MPRPNPIKPGPGQESVWDYPRPPRLEPFGGEIRVVFNGETIAQTAGAYRVLETSHPPTYYLPPEDIRMDRLTPAEGASFCEWKGAASYYTVRVGERIAPKAAWAYHDPTPGFRPIRGYLAFYLPPMDACYVDGEKAQPQPGGFYGGWVTSHVAGPFKGEPGTTGW